MVVLHCFMLHAGDVSLGVCDDGWFNPCTLTAQRATGVQFNPASASNQLRTEDQDTGGRGED